MTQKKQDQFDSKAQTTRASALRAAENAYRTQTFSALAVRCLFVVALALSIGLAGLTTGHAHTGPDDMVHDLDHAAGAAVSTSEDDNEDLPCGRGDPSANCKVACEMGHCAGAAILAAKVFQVDAWSVQDRHSLSGVAPRQASGLGFFKPPRAE